MRSKKMKNFNELKSQWESQLEPETPKAGSKEIIKKVTFLKTKQKITQIILSITAIILICFFFYINALNNSKVTLALSLMVMVLFVRIAIEWFSVKTLKQLNVTKNNKAFKSSLINYYKKRIRVHYVITPVIILLYIFGFITLLPFFKRDLSHGFYTYIKVSSIVTLIILGVFIVKQIQKELRLLNNLRS